MIMGCKENYFLIIFKKIVSIILFEKIVKIERR